MRHRSWFRFVLVMLACFAVPADTATKLVHGIEHQRETAAHDEPGVPYRDGDAGAAVDDARFGAEESDRAHVDHEALHYYAKASILTTALPAMLPSAPSSPPSFADVVVEHGAVPIGSPIRARGAAPDQPRAPPAI